MTGTLTAICRRPWGWFGAWMLVGAVYGLSVIGAASIGIFVLPIAIIATLLLALVPWTRPGLPGLIAGLGLPPLYVAYNFRRGPGYICTGTLARGECGQEPSPWPWLAAAAFLIVSGGVVFLLASRTKPTGHE